MVSMYVAQTNLVAEVVERIVDLTPTYEENIPFAVREDFDRTMGEIDEHTGRERLFEISEAEYQEPNYIGASYRSGKYIHRISIMYPDDEKWSTAMSSDAELIRNDLRVNATSVTGVQQRHLETVAGEAIVKDDEDPWQRLILDLVVYYEIT